MNLRTHRRLTTALATMALACAPARAGSVHGSTETTSTFDRYVIHCEADGWCSSVPKYRTIVDLLLDTPVAGDFAVDRLSPLDREDILTDCTGRPCLATFDGAQPGPGAIVRLHCVTWRLEGPSPRVACSTGRAGG